MYERDIFLIIIKKISKIECLKLKFRIYKTLKIAESEREGSKTLKGTIPLDLIKKHKIQQVLEKKRAIFSYKLLDLKPDFRPVLILTAYELTTKDEFKELNDFLQTEGSIQHFDKLTVYVTKPYSYQIHVTPDLISYLKAGPNSYLNWAEFQVDKRNYLLLSSDYEIFVEFP